MNIEYEHHLICTHTLDRNCQCDPYISILEIICLFENSFWQTDPAVLLALQITTEQNSLATHRREFHSYMSNMPMVFVLTRCTCAKTILGGPTVLAAFRYSLVSRQYLFPICQTSHSKRIHHTSFVLKPTC